MPDDPYDADSSRPAPRSDALMAFMLSVNLVALVLSLAFIGLGAGVAGREPHEGYATAGAIGVLLVLIVGPIGMLLARRSGAAALERRVDELARSMRALADQALLSDDARRVLNRSTERQMLRRAIEEDLKTGDWEAGLVLCRELADRFGYRADAEELRARIEQARFESLDHEVREGIASVDGFILQRQFDAAGREAARLTRLYSDEPRVVTLQQKVEAARELHKQDLTRRFSEATQADRYEEAMGLLRELDAYLTPAEAAQIRDTAREFVARYRDHLGQQFKQAIEDHDWADAASLGRRIIQEFPNSKMAVEVRGLLDGILAKANATQPATS